MIHIRSELGKGTDVEVNLPLEKGNSSTNCSSMIRSDIEVYGSLEAQKCVEAVRKIAHGKSVAILRDNPSTTDGQACIGPKWQCIEKYFSTWFGFTVIDPEDRLMLANVDLIIGEKDGEYLRSYLSAESKINRVLLIHDGMTCVQERRSCSDKASVESIWNPIGPYKLARAVLSLFKDRPVSKDVQNATLEVPSKGSEQPSISTPSSGSSTPMSSTKQSVSDYVGLANTENDEVLGVLPIRPASDVIVKPEPLQIADSTTTTITNDGETGAAKALQNMQSLPIAQPTSSESPNQTFTPGMLSPQIENDTSLRVLAVDDNILNLQLLHRYLIKRPSDIVVTARNGVEAVAAVRQAKTPFDIILMDLSMPDMDGFEATRLIRVFEKSLKHREASEIEENAMRAENAARGASLSEESSEISSTQEASTWKERLEETEPRKQTHAYIVALTGLASRRDRDEAEESGFDDFLTKPISFSKIGELLTRLSAEKGRKELRV
jgi:CheY-like chemotaxis protein